MSDAVLELRDIVRTFRQGEDRLEILRGASLRVAAGEIVALTGPSGAGKSTFLHIAGLLERPDSGEVVVAGGACGSLSDDERTALRRRSIGFVYQFHHLLPEFTALENLVLPQMIAGVGRATAGRRAREMLEMTGLAERARHRPAEMSGGQQQRVAIARAFANEPDILIADEPTGNLDQDTADQMFRLLLDLVRRQGVGALVATHNPELAARMDRELTVRNGALEQA